MHDGIPPKMYVSSLMCKHYFFYINNVSYRFEARIRANYLRLYFIILPFIYTYDENIGEKYFAYNYYIDILVDKVIYKTTHLK